MRIIKHKVSEGFGRFLADNPGIVPAIFKHAGPDLAAVSLVYAGTGLLLLAAGLYAARLIKKG